MRRALRRGAFELNVLACPRCGGRLRLIATVDDPTIIQMILAHLAGSPSGASPGPAPPLATPVSSL